MGLFSWEQTGGSLSVETFSNCSKFHWEQLNALYTDVKNLPFVNIEMYVSQLYNE